MALVPSENQRMAEKMGSLVGGGLGDSDVVITCKGVEYPAHQVMVRAASGLLATEIERQSQDGNKVAIIPMEAFDEFAVRNFIVFVYKADYNLADDVLGSAVPSNAQMAVVNVHLLTHLKMCALAHAYGCRTLNELAQRKFVELTTIMFSPLGFANVVHAANTLVFERLAAPHPNVRNLTMSVVMHRMGTLMDNQAFVADTMHNADMPQYPTRLVRGMQRRHEKIMAAVDEEIHGYRVHIFQLQHHANTQHASAQQQMAEQQQLLALHQARIVHLEAKMRQLAHSVEQMRQVCPNDECARVFSRVRLDRDDDPTHGAGQGDWVPQCQHCNTELFQFA